MPRPSRRPAPPGLPVLAFREGTPYQGEDLIYDAEAPGFLVRCTRNGAVRRRAPASTSGGSSTADIVVRFPRDWLGDWRSVAEARPADRKLRPRANARADLLGQRTAGSAIDRSGPFP